MDRKEIEAFLGEDWKNTLRIIGESLETDIPLLAQTNSSLLENAGKRMRPILSLMVSRACSTCGTTEDSWKVAAAAELLHNATLLHDDVVDDGDKRRGVPTVNYILGSRPSVLIGDFWLVKSMGVILSCDRNRDRLISLFSNTLSDLAEGEILQLQKASSGDTTREDYLKIIYSKTASLFNTAAMSGAISVGVSEDLVKAAGKYATALGMAFQIKDDILDYGEYEQIGKPVGVDLKERKITMPLLGAFLKAGKEKEMQIREKLTKIGEHREYCDEIMEFVKQNGGVEYAYGQLEEFVAQAKEALCVLRDSREKELLLSLAEYTGKRSL